MANEPATAFQLDGAAGRYRLTGTAGLGSARALLERGNEEFRGQARVEVDLSGLTAVDGAGVAVLLAWKARARAAGQALSFAGLPAALIALARVCGVEAMLTSAGAPTRAA